MADGSSATCMGQRMLRGTLGLPLFHIQIWSLPGLASHVFVVRCGWENNLGDIFSSGSCRWLNFSKSVLNGISVGGSFLKIGVFSFPLVIGDHSSQSWCKIGINLSPFIPIAAAKRIPNSFAENLLNIDRVPGICEV